MKTIIVRREARLASVWVVSLVAAGREIDRTRNRRELTFCLTAFLVAGVWASGPSYAEECNVCPTCSADPAFVQADSRRPELVRVLRYFGSAKLRTEGVASVVVVSEGPDVPTAPDRMDRPYRLILIGRRGTSESKIITFRELRTLGLRH